MSAQQPSSAWTIDSTLREQRVADLEGFLEEAAFVVAAMRAEASACLEQLSQALEAAYAAGRLGGLE